MTASHPVTAPPSGPLTATQAGRSGREAGTRPGGRHLLVGATLPATLARGAAAGIVLGVAYRGWMRLVSTNPSFSWEGTIMIVVFVTVAALAAAVCARACATWRRAGARRTARVVSASLILFTLGGPPATATVPAFATGALALGRVGWSRRTRSLLLLASAASTVASFPLVVEVGAFAPGRVAIAFAGYVALVGISSWLFAIPLAAGCAAVQTAGPADRTAGS